MQHISEVFLKAQLYKFPIIYSIDSLFYIWLKNAQYNYKKYKFFGVVAQTKTKISLPKTIIKKILSLKSNDYRALMPIKIQY
jgi:hypothetical protein